MADQVTLNGIEIRELAGRTGADSEDSTAIRLFRCSGSADPTFCRTQLLDQTFYDIWDYDGLNLLALDYEGLAGPLQWKFTANYGIAPLVGEYTVSIDTSGGLVKRTSAFAQTLFNSPGFAGPDYGVSVDVQDNKVQGVDTIIPALKLDITAKIDKGLLTDPIAYSKLVASVTGQTNQAAYLDFAIGELLFAGANGDVIVDRDPTMTYTFIASQNVTGLSVGPIANITKAGHDYIWFKYTSSKSNDYEVQTPAVAYVARVYGEADMSVLGIGDIAPAAQRMKSLAYVDDYRAKSRARQRSIHAARADAFQQFQTMKAAAANAR